MTVVMHEKTEVVFHTKLECIMLDCAYKMALAKMVI